MKRINEGFKTVSEREAVQTFMNMCFVPAMLASGSLSVNLCTGQTIQYAIDGYIYSQAAISTANYTGSVTSIQTASGYCRVFAVGINSAGSLQVFPGSAVSLTVSNRLGSGVSGSAYLPSAVPASMCIIGMIRVSCLSNASITLGSTILNSLSATAGTIEFFNFAFVPQGVMLSE